MEKDEIKTGVEFSDSAEQEEDILLTAQRYLNIFHQIHIFSNAKRKEFDNSLLGLPLKLKKVFTQIPGGRILLEHVLEVEEAADADTKETKQLIAQKDPNSKYVQEEKNLPAQTADLHLSKDFAKTLAQSFAVALKESNILPSSNNRTAISSTDGEVSAMSQSMTKNQQQNTQNNAAATTINNINLDSSIVQNLSEVMKNSNKQYHDDFVQAIERLSEKLSPTTIKSGEIPISLITDSIAQVLKDTGRQQMEAMKTFGASLANTILRAQKGENIDIANAFSADEEPDSTYESEKKDYSKIAGTSKKQETAKKAEKISATAPINTPNKPAVKPEPVEQVKPAELKPIAQPLKILEPKEDVKPVSLAPKLELNPVINDIKPVSQPQQPYYEEYADTPTNDDEEWEYVDEYGNPVSADGDEEWEYVDEYGNPVSADGDEEWEYVDEYGNPVSADGNGEWEYVDEEIIGDNPEDDNEPLSFAPTTVSNKKPEPQKTVSLNTPQPKPEPQKTVSLNTLQPKPEPQKTVSLNTPQPKPEPQKTVSLNTPQPKPEPQKNTAESQKTNSVPAAGKNEPSPKKIDANNTNEKNIPNPAEKISKPKDEDNLIRAFENDFADEQKPSKKTTKLDDIDAELEKIFTDVSNKKSSNMEMNDMAEEIKADTFDFPKSSTKESKSDEDELDKLIREFTGS